MDEREIRLKSLLIASVLYYHDRGISLIPTLEKHITTIKKRSQILRSTHVDGFRGAEIQARSEWVMAVLDTKIPEKVEEKKDDSPGKLASVS
jgi:hypothetical protein